MKSKTENKTLKKKETKILRVFFFSLPSLIRTPNLYFLQRQGREESSLISLVSFSSDFLFLSFFCEFSSILDYFSAVVEGRIRWIRQQQQCQLSLSYWAKSSGWSRIAIWRLFWRKASSSFSPSTHPSLSVPVCTLCYRTVCSLCKKNVQFPKYFNHNAIPHSSKQNSPSNHKEI